MNIEIIDGLVIALYLIGIFTVAIIAGKKNPGKSSDSPDKRAQDKFLANKSLTFTESLASIIATEVSALTFLGIPAFAFNSNFSFIQIYLGAILGRLVIAKVFLPKVYDQGLTIYEVMAKETGLPSGQRTVAIIYTFSKVLSVGVRLFSGSILVGHFLGLNVYESLILVSSITFLYTLIGGLKAVVRTDVLQLGLFVSGGLIAHYLIPDLSGRSWVDLMSLAHTAGKTSFFSFENPMGFIFGFMGGFLFDMSTHGVDQDFAQRLTANESLKKAQLAIFFSSFLSITVGLIFLGVGALLWAHYQTHPFPEGVPNADHLFSHFIVNYFPVGVRGIMVGGVLAATMSTLDSTINALCSTVYNDIIPKKWEHDVNRTSFIYTLLITILLTFIAMVASNNGGLLLLGLKIQSWTGGALLGLFLTKVIFKNFFPYRLDVASVLGAYVFGVGGVYLNTKLGWDWNLNVYWGCIMSMLYLKIYSTLKPLRP
jgi:solute:Na+ symporter, SSS family